MTESAVAAEAVARQSDTNTLQSKCASTNAENRVTMHTSERSFHRGPHTANK